MLVMRLDRSAQDADIDARLDAIFASVRNCSKTDVWERVQRINFLLEEQSDSARIRAVGQMERLNDRLRIFAKGSRGDAYAHAREHLLCSWRHIMRGNYAEARDCLASAADCCDDMA
jgi:hypothetical protein